MIEKIFESQKLFQKIIGEVTTFITPYEKIKACNIQVRRSVDELFEAMKEMPFDLSGYGKSKKVLSLNTEKIVSELIDAQLFLINAFNILGITPEEFLQRCNSTQNNNVLRWSKKQRFRAQHDNFLIVIEGPDGVGKTSICNELSVMLGYPIMQMPNTAGNKDIEEYSQFYRKTIQNVDHVLIMDRFYPSSIVYGQFFERNVLLDDLKDLHKQRDIYTFIIDRDEPYRGDDFINEEQWPKIREIYLQQAKLNKWTIINNNTTLDNCVNQIIEKLQF